MRALPMPVPFLELNSAAAIINAGGIVIYPTETFWAIGCSALNPQAVSAIFHIKARDTAKPLPLLTANAAQAGHFVDFRAAPPRLAQTFWPGPLSLILPAIAYLAPGVLNDQRKAAVRVTSCHVAAQLAQLAKCPLVATSANPGGGQAVRDFAAISKLLLANCAASGLSWGALAPDTTSFTEAAPSTLLEPIRANGVWKLTILRQGAIKREQLIQPEWELQ